MEAQIRNSILSSQADYLCYQTQMQDQSIVYRLRRSCQKIEQLMNECEKLRSDSDFKLKIICNLQNNLKESSKVIEGMKATIDCQNTQIQDLTRKLQIIQLKMQDHQLEKDFQMLQMRYVNCEQENVILRQLQKEKQQEIRLSQQRINLLIVQNHKLQQENTQYKFQIETLSDKIKSLAAVKNELEIMKTLSYQKNGELEMSLASYRRMVNELSVQANQALKEEEHWNLNYKDLADTVEHIQNLRLEHKLRKLQKTI